MGLQLHSVHIWGTLLYTPGSSQLAAYGDGYVKEFSLMIIHQWEILTIEQVMNGIPSKDMVGTDHTESVSCTDVLYTKYPGYMQFCFEMLYKLKAVTRLFLKCPTILMLHLMLKVSWEILLNWVENKLKYGFKNILVNSYLQLRSLWTYQNIVSCKFIGP